MSDLFLSDSYALIELIGVAVERDNSVLGESPSPWLMRQYIDTASTSVSNISSKYLYSFIRLNRVERGGAVLGDCREPQHLQSWVNCCCKVYLNLLYLEKGLVWNLSWDSCLALLSWVS